ncbi:ABC transporter permease subunit [Streptomyces sp. NPDC051018]|uniref:ABC transporter permease subunit n=1 Tax=Streptomyces sp. NPDC051018 TaxID=3365639 RepID=UPI003787CC52
MSGGTRPGTSLSAGTTPDPGTAPAAPYRSALAGVARDGFLQLVRAEWTKLRSVSRWMLTLAAAGVVTVLISVLSAAGSETFFGRGEGPPITVGPQGSAVEDRFQFTHRTLKGDGSIVARVSRLRGNATGAEYPEWAKAGIIVKESSEAGSPYAAVMLTKDHGVRLQSGFTRDTPGSDTPGTSSRWLKLTREGDTLTGYESADGARWTAIGSVRLAGLPDTVEAGLFVASPNSVRIEREFGSLSLGGTSTWATADFDRVGLTGTVSGDWRNTQVGMPESAGGKAAAPGGPKATKDAAGTRWNGGTATLTGSGDIAPLTTTGDLTSQALSGSRIGLVLLAALGALFITAEYRRGMIRTTATVSARRGRMLLAKALVVGGAAFAVGLVAAVVSFELSIRTLRDNGHRPPVYPEITLTDGPVLRAVIGTAAILALTAVLALAVGALLRHTAAAVGAVIVVIVLPLLLIEGLPVGVGQWLQRFTPTAGFALHDTRIRYDQVTSLCLPQDGCFPQGPWVGFATLGGYAVLVLAVAVWRLRRSDV